MTCDWVPLIRLGLFEFGTPIRDYIDKLPLTLLADPDDETGWDTYAVPGDSLRVHVDEGQITSIACYDNCILKGKNLIGLDFDEAKQHLGADPSEEPDTIYIDEEPQQVFEFDYVEAQLWVKDGRVVTVFCGPSCDEQLPQRR